MRDRWPSRLTGLLAEDRWAWRIAFGASLTLGPALLAGRAIADLLLSVTGMLFLATRFAPRAGGARAAWGWALRPWHALALVFWIWQIGVSLARGDGHQIIESIVLVRLFVFLAALEVWVLDSARARRWFGWAMLASAFWVGIECWQQYLTGYNLFHEPRWGDGSLTGPILKPRAGQTFVLLAFPAFLPVLVPLLERNARWTRLAGGAGVTVMLLTQVLIGQRMPTLLMLLGLGIAGLMLRPLRQPVAVALAVGTAGAALTRFVSPLTYYKLVLHFSDQMMHFMATQYAQLFERAFAMIVMHPWLGLGFDGFRDHCLDAVYQHNLGWFRVADPTSPLGCSIHPHNYYLQVATGAGLPGLALFVLLALAWLWRLGQGASGSARRIGPFVAAAIVLWPIASTTSFFTLPNIGWILLAIGWGLAEARG